MAPRKILTGWIAGIGLCFLILGGVALASGEDFRGRTPEGAKGIAAVQALEVALEAVPGQVLELEPEGDRYEIRIRTPEGRTEKVYVEARSGRVLKTKPDREHRHQEDPEHEDEE